VRLEEEQAMHARTRAHTRLRAIAPGYLFTLKNCPRQTENRAYLIVGVDYRLQEGGYASGSSEARYDFDFITQPTDLPYRAPSVTPTPKATGPQTAVVVGPVGQEIWTDRYGRVKLQFRWDRYGSRDENSSCWVRVSEAWAGANFGSLHVPRVGQEVVVDFLNGELDRPLITGRIYNADQMPPFGLPEAATQSGLVTRTPGGTSANANMLRFEDKQGAEQLSLHAERDYAVSVENDATHDVGRNQTVAIANDAKRSVGRDYEAAVANNETRHVGHDYRATIANDATQSVGGNSETAVANDTTITVGGSTVSVVKGNTTSVVLGTAESLTLNRISVLGTGFGISGAVTDAFGSLVTAIGSSVGATGSSVTTTGSSVSSTGSSVTSTGSSVTATGVSFNTVGLSVTF
jgi:type VI secretion system secreted protein VgrG